MKKLSKFFGLLSAALLLGAIIGCDQGSSVITVETPALTVYEPVKTKYGVLLTWKPIYEEGYQVIITRQEKDGEEKWLNEYETVDASAGHWSDKFKAGNILEDGKEYTYRFYNHHKDAGIIATDAASLRAAYQGKDSVVEKKVKYDSNADPEDVIAEKGTKLDAPTDDDIEVWQSKTEIGIKVLAKNELADIKYVVKNAAGDIVQVETDWWRVNFSTAGKNAGEYTVEITRKWDNDYYAASDPLVKTFTVDANADNISVWGFSAVQRDADVILKWFSDDPAETPDFKIERSIQYKDKWEVLDVEVASGTMYNGDKYYTATDSTAKYGYAYTYRIKPSDKTSYSTSTDVTMGWKINNYNLNASRSGNAVTLQWTIPVNKGEEPKIESLAIYRADGPIDSYNLDDDISSKYYDLFKKLDITPKKVQPIGNASYIYYNAIDTDVVPNKEYTYIIVIDNKIASGVADVVTGASAYNAKLAYPYYPDGTYNDDMWSSTITISSAYNLDKGIKLKWNGSANTTDYKLFYKTKDNEGKYSEEAPLTATVTSDKNDCYNAVIKAKDLGLDPEAKKISVGFKEITLVIKGMNGDDLVAEDACRINISSVLTKYTTLTDLNATTDPADGKVAVTIRGHNLDKAVLYYEVNNAIKEVCKLKDIEPSTYWYSDDDADAEYTVPVDDLKMGYGYKFIVNFPKEDNYYGKSTTSNEKTTQQFVYKVTVNADPDNALKAKIKVDGMSYISVIESESQYLWYESDSSYLSWDYASSYVINSNDDIVAPDNDELPTKTYYRLKYDYNNSDGTATVTAINNGATAGTTYYGNVIIYGYWLDGTSVSPSYDSKGIRIISVPITVPN